MKRTKKQLLLAMLISMTCYDTIAHDIALENSDGVTIYYKIKGTNVGVTYQGNSSSSYPARYYGNVTIPPTITYNQTTYPVTSIESEAFRLCSTLTSVSIPSSVTSIGQNAFSSCTQLTSVNIPDGIETIYAYTFSNCQSLETIVIPNSVRLIGPHAFYKCHGLTSLTIGSGVEIIRSNAFYYDEDEGDRKNLSVHISDLAAWCNITFDDLWSNPLVDVEHLFLNGTERNHLSIPNGVTAISDKAFNNFKGLTSVSIPNSVTSIGAAAFDGCDNLNSVTFGTGVTSIGASAFCGCGFSSINIPNSVTEIGASAFSSCKKLTSIIIPNSVTSIGESAFYGCTQLSSAEFGSSVTSIGDNVFKNSSLLSSIFVRNTTPIGINSNTFYNQSNITLYVPYGCKDDYVNAEYWSNFKEIIDKTVSIAVNYLGKGTYCSEYPLDFTDVSGIKAYIISGFNPDNGKLILTRAYEIPAGTGLYIDGTPSTTYNIPVKATAFYYSNMLKGVLANSTILTYENGYTNYVLVPYGTDDVIFAHANDATLSANRAYVQIPSSIAGARSRLGIEIDDNTTGIEGVLTPDTEESEGDYYNLNGQKVQNLKRGIYIRNGKKIIIR